ncbi:hypothetical protein PLICRDRAFT_169910 [Plicaturopsis crispa FD-325 SS-3]|nr:hypothetical protein PLICRDRAFT_169910 [Plicaturopsis crispa FD-325 SS-3]
MFTFTVILLFLSPFLANLSVAASHPFGSAHAVSQRNKYARAHSLGDNYKFDARDGWEHVNVTNMQYARSIGPEERRHALEAREPKKGQKAPAKNAGIVGAVEHVVNNVWQGLKGIGSPEPVTITWYTGHDLLNPSCWSQSGWHPTDASFAAALTMEGWTTRPKCFKFLELCHTPKKCVFVRVVDTCAGCAKGSKHVDLTRGAFGALADFSAGILTVQLRAATEPTQWYENLWGPKA